MEMNHGRHQSFPGGSSGKESACNVGDLGLIPGLRRSPGEENGYPFQYACLENSMDRGAWRATVYGVEKSQTQKLLPPSLSLDYMWHHLINLFILIVLPLPSPTETSNA